MIATFALVAVLLGVVGLYVAGTVATTKVIRSELFGISALDPVTYGFAVFLLLVLTVLASYVPARRAATVDPLLALRAE